MLTISGGMAVAAAATIMIVGVLRSGAREHRQAVVEPSREVAITATIAPRIVSPVDAVGRVDSLRWTGVPEADLYRVQIWDTDGTVVWTIDTRSTAVEVPAVIHSRISYFWNVKARTGWDRWVSSDFVGFSVRSR